MSAQLRLPLFVGFLVIIQDILGITYHEIPTPTPANRTSHTVTVRSLSSSSHRDAGSGQGQGQGSPLSDTVSGLFSELCQLEQRLLSWQERFAAPSPPAPTPLFGG